MEKIRLDLNELKVESFVTSDLEANTEGTVFAMADTVCQTTCGEGHGFTCDGTHQFCYDSGVQDCADYTDPQLQSCTGPYWPTEFGCDTGACPTDVDCSHEATACCGPTE